MLLIQSLTLLTSIAFSPIASGLTLEVHERNHAVTAIERPTPATGATVGGVTVESFEDNKIPFEGSAGGISSIFGQGSDLEVLDDKRMKAWGWCFALDGVISDKMPDQVTIQENTKVLKWFYAYALYDSGTWTGYCIQDQ